MTYKYSEPLAKFYEKWYRDCHESAVYCQERDRPEDAAWYLNKATLYFNLINKNWEELNECLATK